MSETPKCSHCRKRPPGPGYKLCDECREKQRIKTAKSRAKKKQGPKRPKEDEPPTKKTMLHKTLLPAYTVTEPDEEDQEQQQQQQQKELMHEETKEEEKALEIPTEDSDQLMLRKIKEKVNGDIWNSEQFKYFGTFYAYFDSPCYEYWSNARKLWAGLQLIMSRDTFWDIIFSIDKDAKVSDDKKTIESARVAQALSFILFDSARFKDFPRILSMSPAKYGDPLLVQISLECKKPTGEIYTFTNMTTLYCLFMRHRDKDVELCAMMDKYESEYKKQ
jgi:hypothetical protein